MGWQLCQINVESMAESIAQICAAETLKVIGG